MRALCELRMFGGDQAGEAQGVVSGLDCRQTALLNIDVEN
jgi:hypothetical protein